MNDYLLWGAGAALLVLLIVRQWLQRSRRRAARVTRPQPEASRHSAPPSRTAGEVDTVSAVHELDLVRPASRADAVQDAAQAAAEQAAREEADREAAEWEARLLAQHLAEEERERARIDAERKAADAAATTLPPLDFDPEPVDDRTLQEQAASEAAEWEARLAAQQAAEHERLREQARAEAEREAALAAEAVAAEAAVAQTQRAIDAHALLERAAQQRAEQAAAQREAERQAEAQAQLQAARSAPIDFTLSAPAPAASPRTPQQCLVMIADDSKVVRIKTSRLLAKHLYRVSLAEDGLDAARQIEIDLPDVLITDVEMPGMDGFELTRQVRCNPRTAHIPIVMITADDEKHRVDAAAAGVSVLLSKPYPEDQLLSYLESTLSRAEVH